MNPKLKLLLWGLGLAAIIGLSALLYKTLTTYFDPQERLVSSSAADQEKPTTDNGTAEEAEQAPPEPQLAPDFSMEDSEGNTVKLSDFLGKPVVLNFWASWCSPCKREMPDFQKVWEEMGEDVTFLMLNATDGGRETLETAKAFLDEQDFSLPAYFDTTQEASYTYGVTSLPTTLFLDKDGYLIAGAKGMIDEETLRKGISMITPQEETVPADKD